MLLPDEIVAASVAPTLRALLVRRLAARGLTQLEIAERLGISQGAVSKHLAGRFRVEPLVAENPRVEAVVDRIADGLASRRLSPFEALAEAMSLVRGLESRGPVCELHEREMPALRGLGCDLCIRLAASPVKAEEQVLANVREAVRLLVAAPALAAALPSVGSNVAMALAGAADRAQVAAVPGGLFEAKGAVRAAAPPEFGVSRTVAEVLLGAHAADAAIRGCVNVRPTAAVRERARALRLRVAEIAAEEEGSREAVARRVRAAGGADVLVQPGALGVEANAYVLGADAVDAARKALRLLEP